VTRLTRLAQESGSVSASPLLLRTSDVRDVRTLNDGDKTPLRPDSPRYLQGTRQEGERV